MSIALIISLFGNYGLASFPNLKEIYTTKDIVYLFWYRAF